MEPLGEASVEGGVVGQDDHRRRDKGADRLGIQRVAGDRFSADARQGGDLGRDGPGGFMVALKGVDDTQDLALGRVGEQEGGATSAH